MSDVLGRIGHVLAGWMVRNEVRDEVERRTAEHLRVFEEALRGKVRIELALLAMQQPGSGVYTDAYASCVEALARNLRCALEATRDEPFVPEEFDRPVASLLVDYRIIEWAGSNGYMLRPGLRQAVDEWLACDVL